MYINNIVLAPLTLKQTDISMYSIIIENYNASINKQDIVNCLEEREDLADMWIQYSEDKRSLDGWCIVKIFFWYEVYFITRGGLKHFKKLFINKDIAVAHYIFHEINEIIKR